MTTFAIVCLLVLTLSIKVQFETPLGFTVPTQLAFIPLLFAVSRAVVPIAVALAFLLAQVPGLIRGTSRASRLVLQVPNAWFAIGPATVFAIAEVNPHHATVALLIIAFAAQCVVDFVVAALLHDVGKIVIPKEIINKPGKLDPEEWEIVKTHTVEGQRMLDQVGGFMREVGLIVRSHHERWDGGGYPDGLAGEQIPLEARIIACCDTWNAMRTDRPYRKALAYDVASAELTSNAGTQFDPSIVDILIGIVEAEEGSAPATATPIAGAA